MAKKIEVFECEFCHTHYVTEELAEKCEKKHLKNPRMGIVSYNDEKMVKPSTLSNIEIPVPSTVTIDYDFNEFTASVTYKYNSVGMKKKQ